MGLIVHLFDPNKLCQLTPGFSGIILEVLEYAVA